VSRDERDTASLLELDAMSTEMNLRKNVENELDWNPSVDVTNVGVALKDGIVTLTGHVPSYWEKTSAERAVKKVAGVKGIANELEVRLLGSNKRDDTDIAADAVHALEANSSVPKARIKVIVKNGYLKLEGDVDWHFQKNAAARAVQFLRGVNGVTNDIKIVPKTTPSDIKAKIAKAFERRAQLDANALSVIVEGGNVTINGKVHTWAERNEAINAIWDAPGVSHVIDHLQVKS